MTVGVIQASFNKERGKHTPTLLDIIASVNRVAGLDGGWDHGFLSEGLSGGRMTTQRYE